MLLFSRVRQVCDLGRRCEVEVKPVLDAKVRGHFALMVRSAGENHMFFTQGKPRRERSSGHNTFMFPIMVCSVTQVGCSGAGEELLTDRLGRRVIRLRGSTTFHASPLCST